MTVGTSSQHVVITPDVCGGKPRIAGRRITVANVVIWHERLGKSADEIATEYDLTLGDVYCDVSPLAEKLREQTRHGENPVLHG